MNRYLHHSPLFAALVCSLIAASVGCQSTGQKLSNVNPLPKMLGKEENAEYGRPERVVATWAEAVLHRNGEGTRGFGGRLFFYDRASTKPIRVEGQLVVYAFAEDGRAATDHKPTKRFVFPPEQFAKHQSESEIGPSYSVWLPWDVVGGPQSEVSLIARFEPLQGGGLVVSDQTRQRLPGTPRPDTMLAEEKNQSSVKQTSYYTNSPATEVKVEPEKKQTMTTTTISLPGRFMNRTPAATTPDLPSTPTVPTAPTTTVHPASAIPTVAPVGAATMGTPTTSITIGTPNTTTSVGTATMGTTTAAPTTTTTTGTSSPTANLKPTPVGTSVQYLTPGESVRQSLQPRSFGSLH